jgi:hypothetical protein
VNCSITKNELINSEGGEETMSHSNKESAAVSAGAEGSTSDSQSSSEISKMKKRGKSSSAAAAEAVPLLQIKRYTPKSMVVYGSLTKKYKEFLKKQGCHYNARLRIGPGWLIDQSKDEGIRKIEELVERLEADGEVAIEDLESSSVKEKEKGEWEPPQSVLLAGGKILKVERFGAWADLSDGRTVFYNEKKGKWQRESIINPTINKDGSISFWQYSTIAKELLDRLTKTRQ